MKNKNIFLVGFILIAIAQVVFAQEQFRFFPESGLSIFNYTLEEINKTKPGGTVKYVKDKQGKKISSIQYKDDWFGIGKYPAEFLSTPEQKLNQITFRFSPSTNYNDIYKRVISVLGEPSFQEKEINSRRNSSWIKGGLIYSLHGYEDSVRFYINESKFDSYTAYKLSPRTYILSRYYEDVTGDKLKRNIYLLGRRFDETALFFDKIYLLVENYNDTPGKLIELPEEFNGGYDAKLQLIDFTGDKLPELFISAATGGSGGIINYFVYSFKNNKPEILFSPEQKYMVEIEAGFLPGYKASVLIKNNKEKIILDLSRGKKELHFLKVYKTNGKLNGQKEIWLNSYGMIEFKDADNDGINELIGTQAIKGVANYNSIGKIISTWKWKQDRFVMTGAKVYPEKR